MDADTKKMWAIAANTGAVGLEIALAIGIGYFGGRYLDGQLGTKPWLEWVGFGAGIGASIKALIRVVRTYQKSIEAEDKNQPENHEDQAPGSH